VTSKVAGTDETSANLKDEQLERVVVGAANLSLALGLQ